MTNDEKQDLMNFVKRRINGGYDCPETVKALQKIGFKASTIRSYYKIALSLSQEQLAEESNG